MKVKIDTKEKMHVITVKEAILPANMTEELGKTLLAWLATSTQNVIINFENVQKMDVEVARRLLSVQQTFYDADHSMVFYNFQPDVKRFLEENKLLEAMNVTPTESEAMDIVQMDEIERELKG
jgi:anti-anti-sigma regulatory factor